MRVRTASRLHFGLLSLPVEEPSPHADSRRFWGGAGLMISDPGIELTAEPEKEWRVDGPLSQRVLHFVNRFLSRVHTEYSTKLHFTVKHCAPDHQGLGTGTQLALATARILADAANMSDKSATRLAEYVGRGARSAIGIHGFDHGGFLVEAGKHQRDAVSPLIARADFPLQWRIVLIFLGGHDGLHGIEEKEAFEQLRRQKKKTLPIDELCRLILLGMLPALHEQDLQTFGESLYEFNRRVGEMFQPVQGGIYAHPRAEEIVTFLRAQKIRGAGQSSWGPTLFAVAGDEEQAQHMAQRVRERFSLQPHEVVLTQAANQGAAVNRC